MSRFLSLAGYAVFVVALIATVASLAMSEVYNLIPCVLCWYQRICMYPLVVIAGVGILRRDAEWPLTLLPLAVIGWIVAFYHSLLQWNIIPEKLAPCVEGVSCVTKQVNVLGFVTIPFMSLLAFSVIITFSALYLKGASHDKRS